jgi:Universal stress protein UspA and related nucleotide-binding proteins
MYSKILVPLDGSNFSEQILPYARFFADAHRIPVELLRVTDPELRPPFWPTETADLYLRRIAAEYFSGVATSTAEVGAPGRVIVDYAKRDSSCLIAMATHGMSGARRWLVGSVTSKVVQTAANPLLLIRPSAHADALTHVRMDKIFVPLDGSGLAEKTLPHACALAKRLNLEMHLLRVCTLPLDAYVVTDGDIAQDPAQLREELAREAQAYLDGKVAALSAMGFERVVAVALQGDPASEIIDLTRKTPNSLVAMSTHGRSGIGRWVLGSVAERVVQHSQDPVLLIRAK